MSNVLSGKKVAFLGAGSIAEAVIRGLINTRTANPDQIYAVNSRDESKPARLREQYGVHATCEPAVAEDWANGADLVVIAMKPKDAAEALLRYRRFLRPEQLLVSVIAGLSIATIGSLLANGMPIVRTMPNTSSNIGLGATGMAFSAEVTSEQKQLALALFNAVGMVSVVDEPLIDMVNGISGSGPAYVYFMMEAMIEAGVSGGLTPEDSRALTVQTFLGAARMVQETGEDPAELRRKVTSPNGTTQTAIETFQRFDFQESVHAAVRRCVERARELGAMINDDAASKQG